MKTRLLVGLAALCALLSLSPYAMAQAYPNRPIKIIVPYTPGDGPDVIARLIGNKISERLGQPVLIDNKAGASGQIGLDMTAKSPPDGYTLGVGLVTNLALAPHAYKSIPYDVLKDFAPVALGAVNYLALVARPDAPF
jgi:tripartite-type tricarboxylate transporter receptor subunit TctC